jgi:hypothetical protein
VDGTITGFTWAKVSGPSSYSILSPGQAQTNINNLVSGTYQFELTVADNAGATSKDTVSIIVQPAVAVVAGSLSAQQQLFAVINPISILMEYDANGKIIGTNSTYYEDRKVYYDANNKLSRVEIWSTKYVNGNVAGENLEVTYNYIHDGQGNVIKINETKNGFTELYAEYTYNSDNTLHTKTVYELSSSGVTNTYLYTNGNLTALIDNYLSGPGGDTTYVTYDSRPNTFKNIYPEFYFLDFQTTIEQTNRSEIFYFSNNYPVDFGGVPVSVRVNAANKPYEVSFYNTLWYRYLYN